MDTLVAGLASCSSCGRTGIPRDFLACPQCGAALLGIVVEMEREEAAFVRGTVGMARAAFRRGDHVFQFAQNVESQEAHIVAMFGSTTTRKASDPSEILNAVCKEGWELINGSFVFREQGQQSRDKFFSSGQNMAIKGTTVGYYLFRRCPENRSERA